MSGSHSISPVKYCQLQTSDAAGSWTGTVTPGLKYWVQPMTVGDFTNSLVLTGNSLTVTFKKFQTGGLGLNLGTLLSVSIFQSSTGAVDFNLVGSEAC